MKDPIPKFGGRTIPGTVLVIILPLLLLASGAAWYFASDGGGYREVDKLASVKCLGCLGLDPVVPGFSEFWTAYPEDHLHGGEEVPHPDIVIDTLDDDRYDLLILFFWTQGCVPCAEQWEEMVDRSIAAGPENGGHEGDRYEHVRIISNDAAEETGLYHTYTPTGKETGVPMTTFLFRDAEGKILWWSHYGKMEIGDLEEMIESILDYIKADRLKHDYDEISSSDS